MAALVVALDLGNVARLYDKVNFPARAVVALVLGTQPQVLGAQPPPELLLPAPQMRRLWRRWRSSKVPVRVSTSPTLSAASLLLLLPARWHWVPGHPPVTLVVKGGGEGGGGGVLGEDL